MNDQVPLGPLPDPDGDDELSPTARQLRDALAARAAGVQPADRLEEIRMTSRTVRRRTRAWAAVAGVAAVVVVGGGAYAVTRGGGEAVTTVASSPSASSSTPSTSPSSATPSSPPASSSPTAPASSPAAATSGAAPGATTGAPAGTLPTTGGAVPVYWLGGEPARLFREFVAAGTGAGQGTDDPTRALRAMLGGQPADPDYTSPWSPDASATVTRTGGRLVVDLAASAASGDGAGADLAVQQLVHTVTAAAGEVLPVQIRVDGKSSPTLFGTAVPETVSRAPQADVQAPAWITSVTPAPGALSVEGVGTAFEGTLLYTLTDAAGAEVAREAVQAGANGTFGEFSFTVQVPAGSYVLAVFAPDESGGEGVPQVGDTKQVTVP